MKKLTLILSIFAVQHFSAQEFATFKNGLIYNEVTMNKLTNIVDSLNLKYKVCDLTKQFYSKQQSVGFVIRLKSKNAGSAKKDMEQNISIEDFIQKYPKAEVRKNILFIKSKTKNYRKKDIISYDEVAIDTDYGTDIEIPYNKSAFEKASKNTWVYDYSGKDSYSDESITAFYFTEDFKTVPLNQKYSKQIIYSDCLIDTNTTKFIENAKDDDDDVYVESIISLPEDWRHLSQNEKKDILDQMRSRQAVGSCSQDRSPRIQGVNMALLSAETGKWDVFLKSHLDIMNDRFERASDGSYAWKERQTYIKELEDLNINVFDLLFGITLRVENPVKNHYYGSIGRLGRAIAESKDQERFMQQMLSMIEDNTLDDYNRILTYFLFINCNHHIQNETQKNVYKGKLDSSVKKLPSYISEKISQKKV